MGKKRILQLGILLVCILALIVSVQAAEKETVSLTLKDNQVEAKLELPREPEEDVVSLQLSFRIQGDGGNIKADEIDFAFDAGLPASAIQQCRYQEDTGILSIYISGKENLYKSQDIPLGRVVLNSDRSASVSVVKDSFKTVNSAFGMYQGEVNTGDGGIPINNNQTDNEPENDGTSDGSSQGGNGSGDSSSTNPAENDPNGDSTGNTSLGGNRKPVGADKKNPVTGTVSGMINSILNPDGQGSGNTTSPEGDATGEQTDSSGGALPGDVKQTGAKKEGLSVGEIASKVLLGLGIVTAAGAAAIGGRVAYVTLRRQRRRRRRMQNQRNRQRMQAGREAAKSAPVTQAGKEAVKRRPVAQAGRETAKGAQRTPTGRPAAERRPGARTGRTVAEGVMGTQTGRKAAESRPGTRRERPVAEASPGRRPGTRTEKTMAERSGRMRTTGTGSRSTTARRAQSGGQSAQTAWRQEKPYVRKKRKIG